MANDFDELWDKLVSESGQAATVQGEVVRAGRMAHDYFANGSCNWDAGFERLASFAVAHLADDTFGPQMSAGIRLDIEKIQA